MELTAFILHLLAMAFMLCDHLWATIVPGSLWLTTVGRLAFPIFAFMIVEGYFHTHSLKQYMGRLLILAVVSEIPFNLLYGGSWVYPFHQNVIWTFLIGLVCIFLIEKAKDRAKPIVAILAAVLVCLAGFVVGMVTFVDYFGFGVVTVLVFYFFRGHKPWQMAGQFVGLWILNCSLMAAQVIPVTVLGFALEIPLQGAALLALIPIWLYHGKQGIHNRWTRIGFYAFYPVHLLILAVLWLYV